MDFIEDLYNRPIAIDQAKANEQHYEVPTEFLKLCLGPRMKYSSCEWPTAKSSLADAEDTILADYCVKARLGPGLRGVGVEKGKEVQVEAGKEGEGLKILDLGCGWGSLGLFLAEVSHCACVQVERRMAEVSSTTPVRKLPCCPTLERKKFTLKGSPKIRGSTISPLSLAMSMCSTLKRRNSESSVQSSPFPVPSLRQRTFHCASNPASPG